MALLSMMKIIQDNGMERLRDEAMEIEEEKQKEELEKFQKENEIRKEQAENAKKMKSCLFHRREKFYGEKSVEILMDWCSCKERGIDSYECKDCKDILTGEMFGEKQKYENEKQKYGEWVKSDVKNYYKCSNCGGFTIFPTHNKFCPNCGSKMKATDNGPFYEDAGKEMTCCKHCGGQGRILKSESGKYYVECSSCHCKSAEFDTPEESVKYWALEVWRPYADYILSLHKMIENGADIEEIKNL